MRNREALRRLRWILGRMDGEASKRGAPVHVAEKATEGDPFKILVFTMLSARTRDETTLAAVERLFKAADNPEKILALGERELEKILYGVGFYRMKAKNLLRICEIVARKGRVPDSLESLLSLPGVGRKTANIVLARAFGKNALGVDVHVHRISNRLGIVKTKTPEQTEKALTGIVPEKLLGSLNRNFVAFGQTVCTPREPSCPECPLKKICWRIGVLEPCPSCRFTS